MGFQVRAANLGGKAGKGGALGLIGHQAAMQAALQKVDLEFIKAQKVDGFGVQGAQKQAKQLSEARNCVLIQPVGQLGVLAGIGCSD
jgi:hypothetical protein